MFKKLAIVAVAVICGAFLLTHTKVGSYTRTAWNRTWEKAQNQVPMEFEIDRIRDEISHLKGDVHHQLKDIANEIVAVDNLKTDVSQARQPRPAAGRRLRPQARGRGGPPQRLLQGP